MTSKTVAVAAALLVVVLVALAGPAPAEERVLYCTETDSVGFKWEEGQTEGGRTGFNAARYVVKVLSEKRRTVIQTTGDVAGDTRTLTCRRAYTSSDPDLLACDTGNGTTPWLFSGSNFVHAFMPGPPVGGGDLNIFISYGTCTGF